MDELQQRLERGGQRLVAMLGAKEAQRVRQAWRQISPEFERYVVEFLAGEIWSRPGLDQRTKSLVTIAALTALGRWRGMELNVRMALRNGATREEVLETLLHLAPYVGFPATWEGLTIAQRVFQAFPEESSSQ